MKPYLFLLTALFPAVIQAGPRTSAAYAVAAEVTDGGGRRSGSASYTNDGSVGGGAGISVAAPTQTAKAGYVGQLYDVTGLALNAATLSLNEGTTLQLGAWQVLDDASFLTVPAGSVAWSVASGPLTGIGAGGLATAGVVYQNTAATAQGSYLGFTGMLGLTVVNVSVDDFGTYAGDGIGDDWQVQYFGANNPLAAPTADASRTGQTNLFKYIAGLNPLDPAARFAVGSQAVSGMPTVRKVVFSPWFGDRTYTIEGSTNLISWTTVTGTVVDNGTTRTVTDATAEPRKFYRVRITKP